MQKTGGAHTPEVHESAVTLRLANKHARQDTPARVQKMLVDAEVPQACMPKQATPQPRHVLERKQSPPEVVYTAGLMSALKNFLEHPSAPVHVFEEDAVLEEACVEWARPRFRNTLGTRTVATHSGHWRAVLCRPLGTIAAAHK